MLSGGAAGLVSSETLRKEQEEIRRREKHNRPLEGLLKALLNRIIFLVALYMCCAVTVAETLNVIFFRGVPTCRDYF